MTLQRAALWAIVVAATLFLLISGRGLLLPIVLGIVLWYMIDALADTFRQPRLGRFRLPQPVGDGWRHRTELRFPVAGGGSVFGPSGTVE